MTSALSSSGTKQTSRLLAFCLAFFVHDAFAGQKSVELHERLSQTQAVAGWGDSQLTYTGSSSSVTQIVAKLLSWRSYDGAVASQSSADVASRQGGSPMLLTVEGGVIFDCERSNVSAHSANPITVFSPSHQASFHAPDGTGVTLFREPDGRYKVSGHCAGKPSIVWPAGTPLMPDTIQYRSWLTLIRSGRNDGERLGDAVYYATKMVAWLQGANARFVIIGQLAGPDNGTRKPKLIDETLKARFPHNFVSTMPALLAASNGSKTDRLDVAAGMVPFSLRADNVPHLNDAGKAIEAQVIYHFIQTKGWSKPVPGV